MFNILNACNDYILGNVIDIIKRSVDLIGIIVPILLIIGGTITLVRLVFAPDAIDDHKIPIKRYIANQFVSAVVIFFLPFILNTTMEILAKGGNNIGITEGGKTETFSISTCWNNIKKADTSVTFVKTPTPTNDNVSISGEQGGGSHSGGGGHYDVEDSHSGGGGHYDDHSSGGGHYETSDSSRNKGSSSGASTASTSKTYDQVVLVGDSRFVQQSVYAPGNKKTTYVAQSSQGLDYLKSQINTIKSYDSADTAYVINMGVNDYWKNGITSEYISYLNNMAKTVKGKIYFLSVNPVDEAKEKSTNQMYITYNSNINKFNDEVKKGLDSKITYLDSNAYLKANGFGTVDGIHYDEATYKKIYNFISTNVKS